MEDCIFCKIIQKDIPAATFFEDEHTMAFFDIHPISRGHALIIPKKHSRHFISMEHRDTLALMTSAQYVAQLLTKKLHAQGMNISMNCEAVAGQVVFHTHVHLIPRYTHSEDEEIKNEDTEKLVALMQSS
jgi:histidine triad (HIT) family protein